MKKRLFCFVIISLTAYGINFGQKEPNTKAKETLNAIWLAYTNWNNKNCEFREPLDYIFDKTNNRIIGQQLSSPSEYGKYAFIRLNWEENNITSAVYQIERVADTVRLTWEGDKLTGIMIDGLNNFDYLLSYDQNGLITEFACKKIINGKFKDFSKVEYNGMQLAKITGYRQDIKKKEPFVDWIVFYDIKPGDIKVNSENYYKKEIDKSTALYKKTGPNQYYISESWGEEIEYTYNNNDTLINKKITDDKFIKDYSYTYLGGKLFTRTMLQTKKAGNEFYTKEVVVRFSLNNMPESVPSYEKTYGTYRFNQQGELIYESDRKKFREKVNGVWSDWKIHPY